jgi:predicted PurR-regulated permease PerM
VSRARSDLGAGADSVDGTGAVAPPTTAVSTPEPAAAATNQTVLDGPPDGRHQGGARVPRFLEVGAAWGWRFVVVAAACSVVVWLIVQLRLVVIPVFVAAILAALLAPAVELASRALPRLAAVWLTLVGALGALFGIGWFLRGPVASATDELRSQWDTAIDDVEDWAVDGPLGLDRDDVDTAFTRVADGARSFSSGLFDQPADAARTVAEFVTGLFLAIVLTFFLLKDGPSMWRWFLTHLHPSRQNPVDRGGRAAFRAVQGWIRGVAITGAVDAVLIGIALLILGVPGALPLAVITFFAAFFPIIGATLAGALATAVALTTQGPGVAVVVAVVVLVIQQVEGDILLPVVMYRQVALHPVVVLVVLAIGGAVAGIVGAIVAVPTTAAIAAAVSAAKHEPGHDEAP